MNKLKIKSENGVFASIFDENGKQILCESVKISKMNGIDPITVTMTVPVEFLELELPKEVLDKKIKDANFYKRQIEELETYILAYCPEDICSMSVEEGTVETAIEIIKKNYPKGDE